jgi:hypothetical protein
MTTHKIGYLSSLVIIAGAGAIHIDPTWFHCRLVATSILFGK